MLEDEFFPPREHRIRSCDKPWITRRIKRYLRRKKRAFKKYGKTTIWKRKRDEADAEVFSNKCRFFDKVKERMLTSRNPKEYYRAIKHLQTEEAPGKWCVSSLFEGKTEEEMAEASADYFNKISREFTPIEPPTATDYASFAPTQAAIASKIKGMKKPNSRVKGDLDKRIVSKYYRELAAPLSYVYKSVFKHTEWPSQWKLETVTLLPKNKSPNNLSQLRNISCTAFFSKVLESFLLDNLRNSIELSSRQYGGKKGQGVDHMLIEIWDQIQRSLEDEDAAVNVMAVDFEKAFNRMDHNACISALRSLGGSPMDVGLVGAFLHNRHMSVRINDTHSLPKHVPGGAPQGSILACFLFCATIESLLTSETEPRLAEQSNMSES